MNLKKLRLENSKTQTEIADSLGITQFTYSNYENNKTEPNIELLKKLADYYGVTIDYLVGREVPNDLGLLSKEEIDLFKMIKKLNLQNFFKIQGYVLRLVEEQGV